MKKSDTKLILEKLSHINVEISGIKDEIGGIKGEIGGIKGEIGGIKGEIGGIKGEISGIKDEIGGMKKILARHDKNFEFVEDQLQKITLDLLSFRSENAIAHDGFASSLMRFEDEFTSMKHFQKRLDARVTVLEKAA